MGIYHVAWHSFIFSFFRFSSSNVDWIDILQDEIWQTLEKEPLFKKPNRVLSMDEIRLLTFQRWRRLREMGLIVDVSVLRHSIDQRRICEDTWIKKNTKSKFQPMADYDKFSTLMAVLNEFDIGIAGRLGLHSGVSCHEHIFKDHILTLRNFPLCLEPFFVFSVEQCESVES